MSSFLELLISFLAGIAVGVAIQFLISRKSEVKI